MRDPAILDTAVSPAYFHTNYFQSAMVFMHIVNCHNNTGSLSYNQYRAWIIHQKHIAPDIYVGKGLLENQDNCINWTIPARSPTGPLHIPEDVPVLLIVNRFDGAVPLADALHLHHIIAGSRLIITDTIGHTAYNSYCGQEAIINYLLTAKLPAHDERCSG